MPETPGNYGFFNLLSTVVALSFLGAWAFEVAPVGCWPSRTVWMVAFRTPEHVSVVVARTKTLVSEESSK